MVFYVILMKYFNYRTHVNLVIIIEINIFYTYCIVLQLQLYKIDEGIVMGRKSTKENKNIYQISREEMNYSREVASEQLQFISSDRIEKIENERSLPHPEEVLAMAKCYKNPSLCNYFCSHECPIGIEYVPEIKAKELSQITLEMLATLNKLTREKERLIEITVDGELSEDELPDFLNIKKDLEKMALAIDSLNLWLDRTIANGKIDKNLLPDDF